MKIAKIAAAAALTAGLVVVASSGDLIAESSTRTTTIPRHAGKGGSAFLLHLIDDPRIQEELQLTPEQISRLRALRDDARASIQQLRAASIRARADLRAVLLDARASRGEIEKSAAAVRDAAGAVSKEATKRLIDARDVLSVEQREKLRPLLRERTGARRGVRGRGFHRGWSFDTDGLDDEAGTSGDTRIN